MTKLSFRVRFGLIAAFLVLTTAVGGFSAGPAGAGSTEDALEAQLLAQINNERAARGIGAIAAEGGLANASQVWADTMAGRVGLVHSTDGRAEIIARGGLTGQITDAWMRSPSHRNLIVDPNLVVAGVGVRCDANGQIWAVVQFARADTRLGTLRSSASSPIATPATQGSGCGGTTTNYSPSVRRLYQAYFRRASDQGGLDYWVGQMIAGASLTAVSDNFAASSEFQSMYGRLGHRDFVRLVYVNVLGREPDAGGYDYWVGMLNRGTPRGEVMIGFSESAEFRVRTGIS